MEESPQFSKQFGRQNTSLKGLVDKFNKSIDEAIPLPNSSTWDLPSAHIMAIQRSNPGESGQARTCRKLLWCYMICATLQPLPSDISVTRRSPRPKRTQRNQRIDNIGSRPFASQLTISLRLFKLSIMIQAAKFLESDYYHICPLTA